MPASFETSVFINCPFDDSYIPLLRPLLFCILDLGFQPRIALERLDSGEARIEKIFELVEASKFAVHDLSRLQAKSVGEFYRMNMPFELGLDVACRRFKGGKWSDKRLLILEAERFRYQAALSDLSNSDIAVHSGKPEGVVRAVRNWLNGQAKLRAGSPSEIWGRFNEFMAWNFDALRSNGFSEEDVESLPIDELIDCMRSWLIGAGLRPS